MSFFSATEALSSYQLFLQKTLLFGFVVCGTSYVLFQKHLLPQNVGKYVGRICFYPTVPFTYFLRRKAYWTLIDSHVFLGGAPLSILGHVEELHARGVRVVINMCDEYSGPQQSYRKCGIKQIRFPTVDHSEPSLQDMKQAIENIRIYKESGVRVYIHCKSGNGRGAAIAFCWLLAETQLPPKEVQTILNEKRKVRSTLYLQNNINQFYRSL